MKFPRRHFLTVLLLGFVGALIAALGSLLGLAWWYQEPENYSRIEDGLYLGGDVTAPPPGTRAVLNLCEKKDPYHTDISLWEPIRDTEPAPDLDWLRRTTAFVDAQRRADVPTYVHCRNGVSRSGMVVVAYEMARNHWTRDEALAFVRSKRPQVLPNPAFMGLLTEWERSLKEDERSAH